MPSATEPVQGNKTPKSNFGFYLLLGLMIIYLLRWVVKFICIHEFRQAYARGQREFLPFIQRNYGLPDRQGNVFTISEESSVNTSATGSFPNFLYTEDPARLHAHVEKDDKELPSYDEVMRCNNVTMPTAGHNTDNSRNDITLSVPPTYAEIDPLATTLGTTITTSTSTSINIPTTPSTSRAAAESVNVITITNSVSNTTV